MTKTRQQLELELTLKEELEAEREKSDGRYAFKIYERAIIGLITIFVSAVVVAIISHFIK